MIIGIGSDIVQISRIEQLIHDYEDQFLTRIYSDQELLRAKQIRSKEKVMRYYASRFAAKEAFVKALGLGVRQGIAFKQITVINNELGKPILSVTGKAAQSLALLQLDQAVRLHLTISDDGGIALAMVVIEKY